MGAFVLWPAFAAALFVQGRSPATTARLCGYIAARLSNQSSLRASRLRAYALVTQSLAIGVLGDTERSIAINDRVISEFGESKDDEIRTHVAYAMVNKGYDLIEREQFGEATAIFERLSAFVPFEPPFTHPLAQGLMNWALALDREGRHGEEIAIYDRIADTLNTAKLDDPEVHFLAWALLNKAITLNERRDHAEATRLCDAVLHRWWGIPDHAMPPKMREALAAALRHRALAMVGLEQFDVAIADVDRLLDRYIGSAEAGVSEEVAWAMIAKAGSLEQLDRRAEAMRTFDELINRYRRSRAKEVRTVVASARRLREGLE